MVQQVDGFGFSLQTSPIFSITYPFNLLWGKGLATGTVSVWELIIMVITGLSDQWIQIISEKRRKPEISGTKQTCCQDAMVKGRFVPTFLQWTPKSFPITDSVLMNCGFPPTRLTFIYIMNCFIYQTTVVFCCTEGVAVEILNSLLTEVKKKKFCTPVPLVLDPGLCW